MNIAPQLRQITRFGTVARHIDSHLDDALTLADLADLAHMTRHRLDEAFHAYAEETPMHRVWRLRLLRARQHIATRPERPLLDVALDAGYGSAQAFSRAFRRLHGEPPAASRGHTPAIRPTLRIETLPVMTIQFIPYAGAKNELAHASNELRARAMACAIERHKRFGWMVGVEENLYAEASDTRISLKAALLHAPLQQRIPGLDAGQLGGGPYAVFGFQSGVALPSRGALLARIEQETGWRPAAGPWLRRCRNAQYLPSFLESRFEIYVPLRAGTGNAAATCDFVLEK